MFKRIEQLSVIGMVFCFLLVSPALWGASPASVTKLDFAIYVTEKPATIHGQFKPVLNYLEKELTRELKKDVNIRLKIIPSYDATRQAVVKGIVDFARLGPSSYVLARSENPKVKLLAIEEEEGGHMRKGVIFARKDRGITKIEDLKGKSFAFGDPDSTTGRYLAQAFMVDAGIFAKDLQHFEYLHRHDKVCEAVLAGKFDAGTAGSVVYDKYKSKGLEEIVSFDNITKPWVVSEKMDPKIETALRKILINLKDKEVLTSIDKKTTGFFLGKDSLYDPVKAAMKKSEKFSAGFEEKK